MHDVVRTSPPLDAWHGGRLRRLERDGAAYALDALEWRHALNGAIADRTRFRVWEKRAGNAGACGRCGVPAAPTSSARGAGMMSCAGAAAHHTYR